MPCPGPHPREKGLLCDTNYGYAYDCVLLCFEYFIAVIHDKWFSSHHSTDLSPNNDFVCFFSS